MRPGQLNRSSTMSLVERNTPWWNRRSRLERWLLASSSFFLLMCVVLALVLITKLSYSSDQAILRVRKAATPAKGINSTGNGTANVEDNSSVCLTPGCIFITAKYLERANLSADPCKDFYNYACGQYEANTVIPDHEAEQTSFLLALDNLNKRLKILLESRPDPCENKAFGLARAFYNVCVNKTEINILKEQPLKDLLKQLGGWPAVEGEKWTTEGEPNFVWSKTIYALRKLGVTHELMVDLSIKVDSKNISKYSIDVDEASLGTGSGTLVKGINDTQVQKYLKFIVETAVLLGANREKAAIELTDAVKFEIQLANFTLSKEERKNQTHLYNKKTIRELQQIAPMVNWVEFANQLLMDKVDENEVVILVSPNYFVNLTKLLKETPKRTIANYMMWRVSLSVLGMLDDRFGSNELVYTSSITGQAVDEPRWKICLESTKPVFASAIGSMYVRRYLDKNAREMVLTLVRDVRQEFLSILKDVDWMDSTTLNRAINKAKAMEQIIAYPLELLNDTLLDDYYRNISIKENRFFQSTLQIKKAWSDYRYGKLREVRKGIDWKETGPVADVNAYYSPSQNLIMFPDGILQGLFFGSDHPRYVNYGAIGSIIGHEITHGFDDQGRQFDEVGNLKGWWEAETDLKFRNKSKCIINQYSRYNMTSVNMTVNGINTLGENVADNCGMKAAYRAYEKWEADNCKEKTLPGMKLSARQWFWMSFANVWCSKTRPEATVLKLLTDDHSPQKFRVNGVVSNSPQFSADFKCPVGSPMNPVDKCVVW